MKMVILFMVGLMLCIRVSQQALAGMTLAIYIPIDLSNWTFIGKASRVGPGARPTKHISIEFEIRWKFRTL